MQILRSFIRNEEGATMIEYGLIAALISIAGITAMTLIGPQLAGVFTTVQTSLPAAGG